jgi:hypothetical protein
VDPRDVLDAVVKRKIPSPRRKSNPRTPIVQPDAVVTVVILFLLLLFLLFTLKI